MDVEWWTQRAIKLHTNFWLLTPNPHVVQGSTVVSRVRHVASCNVFKVHSGCSMDYYFIPHSISWPNNIPLYGDPTFSLFINQFIDVSTFWLLWIMLLQTFMYKFLTQKAAYYVISFVWNVRNRQMHTENRLLIVRAWGKEIWECLLNKYRLSFWRKCSGTWKGIVAVIDKKMFWN